MFLSAVVNTKKLISLNYTTFLLLIAPYNRTERQDQKDNLHWNLGQDRMKTAHRK